MFHFHNSSSFIIIYNEQLPTTLRLSSQASVKSRLEAMETKNTGDVSTIKRSGHIKTPLCLYMTTTTLLTDLLSLPHLLPYRILQKLMTTRLTTTQRDFHFITVSSPWSATTIPPSAFTDTWRHLSNQKPEKKIPCSCEPTSTAKSSPA